MASGTIILFPTEMEAAPLRRLRPDARIAICGVGMAACAAAAACSDVSSSGHKIFMDNPCRVCPIFCVNA